MHQIFKLLGITEREPCEATIEQANGEIHGVTFEDAVKRMIAAPVSPKPAKTVPKKKRQNPARN